MANEKAEVLFENEKEYFTDSVVRIGGDYFFRHENGGSGGSWDACQFKAECKIIDRSEARRLALEWGENPGVVAEKLT